MNFNFYNKKLSAMACFVIALFFMGDATAKALQVNAKVTGTVTSAEDNQGLPGVTVLVKDTQTGTVTNVNGEYSIEITGNNPVLVFSYVGYETTEIPVNGRSTLDVALAESLEALQEVVVTALGIEREERSLGYSVGRVDGEDLSRVANENVLNSLAGKVPGVTINATGGAGSSVSMIIRGAISLNGDNQPLFVVDGVPIANTLNNVSQIGDRNPVDYGNAISDINPQDIKSVSVLKGPSAAALYGSRAGNGVVLITTKTGKPGKGFNVSLNTNTVFDNPYRYLDFHSRFATGVRPYTPDNNPYPGGVLIIEEGSAAGVGPELDKGYKAVQWNSPVDENGNPIPTELVSYPDNVKNFVQTGIASTNNVAVSGAKEDFSYRVSYTNMSSRGLIPNSDLFRNTLNLSSSVNLSEKFVVTTNVNVGRSNSNNRPAGDRGTNPLQAAYAVSPHINILDLKDYWVEGQEGLQQRSQAPDDYDNPYFMAYEVNNSFVRDRIFGNLKADWQITREFSLMARYSHDQYNEQRETKIAKSYTRDSKGVYGIVDLTRFERNTDFLATYAKDISDFSLSVSAGGNIMYQKGSSLQNSTRNRGSGLIIPGLYTISNTTPENLNYSNSWYQEAIYSVYGIANLGFRDMIYLDLTYRNDWSSTLPEANRSYDYPSASLSVILSEMIDMPGSINLLKLRSGWARAGNDAPPYSLYPTLDNAGAWDGVTRLGRPGYLLTPDLKPEIATSFEVGADLGFFNNRLRFEGTYYTIDNKNQILGLGLPPSSGYTSKTVNAGLVSSEGWEFLLGGTPIDNNGWIWDINANITRNRTTIKELSDDIEIYTLWTDAKGGAWTYVGEQIGDIYDRQLVTVEDPTSPYFGYPILNDEGSWQDIRAENTKNKIGNFNPDFILGMQTSVSYKGFSLNMTFDWRQGGDFVSQTYRYSESDLKTQRWLDQLINPNGLEGDALRDWLVANEDQHIKDGINVVGGPGDAYGGFPFTYGVTLNDGVFNPGVIAEYDEDGNITGYIENLGGPETKIIPYADNYPWSFTESAMFDASFIKLREVSLAYQLPKRFVNSIGINDASFAIYSRNIILWTKAKVGIDPESAYQPDSNPQGNGIQFKQGIERYNVTPWVIPVGVRLSLNF